MEKQNNYKEESVDGINKEADMDEDLKDVIKYVLGVIVGYTAFLTLLTKIVKDINLLLIYVLILTIFLWLSYMQIKISKIKGGEKK